jgi:hypothetical protein
VAEGIRDFAVGADVFVLTWLHQAQRDVLTVRPRDDPRSPETGVFSTRSQDRPNPIGLHRVHIAAIDGPRVLVRNLEASGSGSTMTRARARIEVTYNNSAPGQPTIWIYDDTPPPGPMMAPPPIWQAP